MGEIDVSVYPDEDLSVFRVSGTLHAQNIIQMLETYYQGTPTRLFMWDFRDADVSGISSDNLKAIVSSIKSTSHSRIDPKTALIIQNTAAYGMGRMFETLIELEQVPISFHLFHDSISARTWLFE